MFLTFMNYFDRNNESIEKLKTNIQNLLLEINVHNDTLAKIETGMRNPKRTKLNNRIKSIENTIAKHEEDLERREFLAINPDDMVKEYLLTLPAYIVRIELQDLGSRHSLTTVPDLSRFTHLIHLILINNRLLSSGFDRLPTTLKRVDCYKTNVEDTAWILRLNKLESLDLRRNDLIREFPDLSGMTNLTYLFISELSLTRLPSLPLDKITFLRVPIQGLSRYYSKIEYGNSMANDIQTVQYLNMRQSNQFIHRINRINQFDRIREELLDNGAKISLNPLRIKRLLDQSEIDLDSDWSDIYEFQTRRVHTTDYSLDYSLTNQLTFY